MSEKKAAAVLHIRPSDAAIEYMKGRVKDPKGWRDVAEEMLSRHLELRAAGDCFARIHAGAVADLTASEVQSVLTTAENAGLQRASELRAQKRLESLSSYTTEELQAALAAAGKAGDPKAERDAAKEGA